MLTSVLRWESLMFNNVTPTGPAAGTALQPNTTGSWSEEAYRPDRRRPACRGCCTGPVAGQQDVVQRPDRPKTSSYLRTQVELILLVDLADVVEHLQRVVPPVGDEVVHHRQEGRTARWRGDLRDPLPGVAEGKTPPRSASPSISAHVIGACGSMRTVRSAAPGRMSSIRISGALPVTDLTTVPGRLTVKMPPTRCRRARALTQETSLSARPPARSDRGCENSIGQ
jgi:hypothetical protein